MKITRQIFILTALATVLGACSSSNNVVSERLIQKRKYNKGFFVSKRSTDHNKTVAVNQTEAVKSSTNYKATAEEAQNSQVEEQTNNAIAAVEFTPKVTPKKPETEQRIVSTKESALTTPEITKEDQSAHRTALRQLKKERKTGKRNAKTDDTELILLVILCFLLPPIAVGLATDWETTPLIISILLTIFFWIPGVIYALIVVLG